MSQSKHTRTDWWGHKLMKHFAFNSFTHSVRPHSSQWQSSETESLGRRFSKSTSTLLLEHKKHTKITNTLTLLLKEQKRGAMLLRGWPVIINTHYKHLCLYNLHTFFQWVYLLISKCDAYVCICMYQQVVHPAPALLRPCWMQNSDSPRASHPSLCSMQRCSVNVGRNDSLLLGVKLVIRCASLQPAAVKFYDVAEVDLWALREFPGMIGHAARPK